MIDVALHHSSISAALYQVLLALVARYKIGFGADLNGSRSAEIKNDSSFARGLYSTSYHSSAHVCVGRGTTIFKPLGSYCSLQCIGTSLASCRFSLVADEFI